MRILIPGIGENPTNLLRRAGYVFQRQDSGEMSFVRTFGRSPFPRFHVYAKSDATGILLNMHLDQKKETYGENTRHHGEYENEGALKDEGSRLLTLFGPEAKILL